MWPLAGWDAYAPAMARVSIYLNTAGQTEEQFRFYADVFGTEVTGLMRMGDIPGSTAPEAERDLLMHVEVEITGGMVLMGTDLSPSLGRTIEVGNNTWINVEPDSLEEGQRIFDGLAQGATDVVPLARMFWGAHWGSLLDRYGIRWMVNVAG